MKKGFAHVAVGFPLQHVSLLGQLDSLVELALDGLDHGEVGGNAGSLQSLRCCRGFGFAP
jgi:hypothetical protein